MPTGGTTSGEDGHAPSPPGRGAPRRGDRAPGRPGPPRVPRPRPVRLRVRGVRQRAGHGHGVGEHDQARPRQVRALPDRQRRRLRRQGRNVSYGSLKRKEDARFIRGQGRYVDDLTLPRMLHGAVLRSPFAHARIVSIDTSAALQHPRVHAVLTGADLAPRGMAWMPTLSSDTQAVLATDKVRFQGQEVAFVVADDHYAARDALELIDVEYAPLDAVVDARAGPPAGTPHLRGGGKPTLAWGAGDPG